MKKLWLMLLPIVAVPFISGCVNGQTGHGQQLDVVKDPQFGDHWYQGQAELSSYDLEQARYGEIHDGTAVLIFVTEDFSKSKHVKLDNPDQAGSDKVNVLKLNYTRNFNTGIYPYSMMTSVFTPVDFQRNTLKVTTSSQEWCGHAFTQLDFDEDDYEGEIYSYFESEGSETEVDIDATWLEDEIWNLIRLNPDFLPEGNISIIPATMIQRLRHSDLEPVQAEAKLERAGTLSNYLLEFTDRERTLKITFSSDFPYQIQGWEDTYSSGFGNNAQTLTTKATLKKSIMIDYWNKNNPEDEVLRQQLGL